MNLVVYQFSRSRVERGDFSHFLDIYAPEKLPRGRRLREMMNSMTFMIEGFDDDPREIHSIPEVRSFYAAFRDAWPYWLYFCNLDAEEFQMMVLCCLPSISALKVDERASVAVEFDRGELSEFLRANFPPMNAMCERGGMFERLIYERSKSIFEYFALPFEVPPP
ncbi:MAG: hypothetical protein Q7S40_15425 [Opitutaceae bacterium]|nr:hypothetical protein [Opitutaceae bacterium]